MYLHPHLAVAGDAAVEVCLLCALGGFIGWGRDKQVARKVAVYSQITFVLKLRSLKDHFCHRFLLS